MPATVAHAEFVLSDHHLRDVEDTAWPGVPLLLINGRLAPAASLWLLHLVQRGASPRTIKTYREAIGLYFRALTINGVAWHAATANHAHQFLAAMRRHGCKPRTVNTRLIAVRQFYGWAVNFGYLLAVPFEIRGVNASGPSHQDAQVSEIRTVKPDNRVLRPHSVAEFDDILAHIDRKTPSLRLRDELMCEAGWNMGLRRMEVAGLETEWFLSCDPTDDVHVFILPARITKGQKERAVLAPRLFIQRMQNYIKTQRRDLVEAIKRRNPKYRPPPNVFLNARGKAVGRPITESYITDLWRRAAIAAGIESRFHNNRASFGTNIATMTADLGDLSLVVVKDFLGHTDERTAAKYVQYAATRQAILARAHIVNDAYEKDRR